MNADDSSLMQNSYSGVTEESAEIQESTDAPLFFMPVEAQFDNSMNEIFFKTLSGAGQSSTEDKVYSKQTIVSTVIGGILVMVSLGIVATWGAISLYITSYYRQYDPELTVASASIVYPIQQIAGIILRPLTRKMVQLVGFRALLIVGVAVNCGAFMLCSLTESFVLFVICYGVIAGLASGFVGLMPFWSSWEVLPTRKGAVSGLVQTGIAIGTLLFTVLGQVFTNPHNRLPIPTSNPSEKYYEPEVANNVPRMLLYFGIITGILGLIAAFLIKSPETRSDDSGKVYHHRHQKRLTVKRILTTGQFWIMTLMLSLSVTTGLFIASNYKFYGSTVPAINDDTYLTLVGSVCSVINAGGKMMWGALMDKLPFKRIYTFVLVLQSILTLTLTLASQNRISFLVWVPLLYLCLGSHWVISPVVCSKMYGTERGFEAYSILASVLNLSTLVQYLVVQLGLPALGFPNLLYIFSSMTIASLAVNLFLFREKASSKLLKRRTQSAGNNTSQEIRF